MFLKTPITMIATYFGRIKTPMRRTGNKSSNTVPIGRRTYKANKKRAKQIVSSDCRAAVIFPGMSAQNFFGGNYGCMPSLIFMVVKGCTKGVTRTQRKEREGNRNRAFPQLLPPSTLTPNQTWPVR